MEQTKHIMGMPVTVQIADTAGTASDIAVVFECLMHVDEVFSTYKPASEISRINNGLPRKMWSSEMKEVFKLCEQTKQATKGYFDIAHGGKLDPSGLVKGWAIQNSAQLLRSRGLRNFYIEAGGDIQVYGRNAKDSPWRVGVRNPFNRYENVKVLDVTTEGIATSGTYIRGQHVYNPHGSGEISDVLSLTVIGPNVYDADRFATAAFAMGTDGINFIESLPNFEGYMIDSAGIASSTSGLGKYVATL